MAERRKEAVATPEPGVSVNVRTEQSASDAIENHRR